MEVLNEWEAERKMLQQGMNNFTVNSYKDRLQRELAQKNDEEVEDYEMAHRPCEPYKPFSHAAENQDEPYIGTELKRTMMLH